MKIIISTVGMSVINNIKRKDEKFVDLYGEYVSSNFELNHRQKVKDVALKTINDIPEMGTISAEVKSIVKIGVDKETYLYFIATDTEECELASDIIASYFEKNYKINTKNIRIKYLQVNDSKNFEKKGVKNLFEELTKVTDNNKYSRIILNPTGGYKAVVPYITLFGMIAKKEIKYIFESTDNLIDLPLIPMSYDSDTIERYINKFNSLEEINDFMTSEEFYDGIDYNDRKELRAFIEEEEGYITFSALGKLIYHQYKITHKSKEIFLGSRASKEFEKFNNRERINVILNNIYNPISRKNYLHDKVIEKTDCYIYKEPNTSERVFYKMYDEVPKIIRIFEKHEEYDRVLNKEGVYSYNENTFEKIKLNYGGEKWEKSF